MDLKLQNAKFVSLCFLLNLFNHNRDFRLSCFISCSLFFPVMPALSQQTGKPSTFYHVNKNDLYCTHTSTAGTMSIPTVRNSSKVRKGLKQLPTSRRRILPSCKSELQHQYGGRVHVSSFLAFTPTVSLSYNIYNV